MKFPGPGVYEISYTVCGLKPEGGIAPRMKVVGADLDRVLFERDIIAPEDKPVTVTFHAHFSNPPGRLPKIYVTNENKVPRHPRTNASSRIPFITTKHRRAPWQMKITNQDGSPRYPILIIDSLIMRGPIVTDEEQRRRDEYFAADESLDAVRKGFTKLAQRAFRRPLYDNELDTYINISDAKEFQQLLLADLDTFNETFIQKLAMHGLRRTMTIDDRDEIAAIAEVSRKKDYRVRDILEAFVLSELFQKR